VPTGPQVQPSSQQPPAISGGTLLVLPSRVAVAADPDRDVVWIVDLNGLAAPIAVKLQPGDEPGRVAQDAAGNVHVALRRGGALVSIDPLSATVLERRPVCAAPRGVAYDPALDAIHVACSDGLLATFPAAGGPALRTVQVAGDLRDVVVQNGTLYVSRFRTAELLQLASDGTIAQQTVLPNAVSMAPMGPTTAQPGVAYRTVALPGGGLAMLHQRSQLDPVATTPGAYGGFGMCPGVGVVHDTISFFLPGAQPMVAPPLAMMALAVDMAVSPQGDELAIVTPSNVGGFGSAFNGSTYPVATLQQLSVPVGGQPGCMPPPSGVSSSGEAIAVAYDDLGRLLVQSREPASISVNGNVILLPGASVANDGHDTFHSATKAGIACASCHAEGGDDGRVWQFIGLGPRRTQNLQGGVLARAPFHWGGDIPDMPDLVNVVLEGRMSGPSLDAQQTANLGAWMDAQAALAAPPPADPAAVTRGAALFNDASTGCAGCHSGSQLSSHALVDVGTGGTFKVPSLLGVGYRAPYLHDGCAATLTQRFDPACGGTQHGQTSQLTTAQISDLVAFLASL
jgi:mono/diheme cytochrome c family protein